MRDIHCHAQIRTFTIYRSKRKCKKQIINTRGIANIEFTETDIIKM